MVRLLARQRIMHSFLRAALQKWADDILNQWEVTSNCLRLYSPTFILEPVINNFCYGRIGIGIEVTLTSELSDQGFAMGFGLNFCIKRRSRLFSSVGPTVILGCFIEFLLCKVEFVSKEPHMEIRHNY